MTSKGVFMQLMVWAFIASLAAAANAAPAANPQAAAAALGVSERYVRRLASQGRVQGAKKIGRDWLIPSPPVVLRMAGKAR